MYACMHVCVYLFNLEDFPLARIKYIRNKTQTKKLWTNLISFLLWWGTVATAKERKRYTAIVFLFLFLFSSTLQACVLIIYITQTFTCYAQIHTHIQTHTHACVLMNNCLFAKVIISGVLQMNWFAFSSMSKTATHKHTYTRTYIHMYICIKVSTCISFSIALTLHGLRCFPWPCACLTQAISLAPIFHCDFAVLQRTAFCKDKFKLRN